jgi:hypothetical protein
MGDDHVSNGGARPFCLIDESEFFEQSPPKLIKSLSHAHSVAGSASILFTRSTVE